VPEVAIRQAFKPVPLLHLGHKALVVNSGNVVAEVICQEETCLLGVIYRDDLFDENPKAEAHIGHMVEITQNKYVLIRCIDCAQIIYSEE